MSDESATKASKNLVHQYKVKEYSPKPAAVSAFMARKAAQYGVNVHAVWDYPNPGQRCKYYIFDNCFLSDFEALVRDEEVIRAGWRRSGEYQAGLVRM